VPVIRGWERFALVVLLNNDVENITVPWALYFILLLYLIYWLVRHYSTLFFKGTVSLESRAPSSTNCSLWAPGLNYCHFLQINHVFNLLYCYLQHVCCIYLRTIYKFLLKVLYLSKERCVAKTFLEGVSPRTAISLRPRRYPPFQMNSKLS
jgi:hypothetical protein